MKHRVVVVLGWAIFALCGCSNQKAEPPQQIPAITLSAADKEILAAYQKDLLTVGNLADTAVKFASAEVKNVIKGGQVSLDFASLLEKAKAECVLSGASLAQKAVPAALPPEAKRLLDDGKNGLIAANKAYAESFDAIKRFAADKDPHVLLEYRRKSSQAKELYTVAAGKFKTLMTAAGVSQ
jgi:hypothetical protein